MTTTKEYDATAPQYQRIQWIIRNSLFDDANDPRVKDVKIIAGIMNDMGFDPDRIQTHKDKVIQLMKEILTDAFMEDKGGGHSFLALPFDKYDNQWGEQPNAEEFFFLCAHFDFAKFVLPRHLWTMLPGAMPYIVFKDPETLT